MATRPPYGYTLIELLVVLVLISVLGSIAMPVAELSARREKERELKAALWEIRGALDTYQQAHAQGAIQAPNPAIPYPPSLDALTKPHLDARPSSSGRVLRFLRRVPRDPFADPSVPAEQTWGLRGYLSPPDNPQASAEVYDVYSRSSAIGLNGVPLSRW